MNYSRKKFGDGGFGRVSCGNERLPSSVESFVNGIRARYDTCVPDPLINTPEYTVTELGLALKWTVENAYGYVRVRGEISGFKRAASGHLYLALKDAGAVIDGVMWKGGAAALRFRPEDGLEVVATGKLTTYPGRSKYQIVIERMEPAGAGALMALLEARKAKLAGEGLFETGRKRPLPYIPEVIGVVTSPTGAVIRDILHRLAERFPRRVLVWPVAVQGENAAAQVANAVAGFNALAAGGAIPRPDLIIVARGGGSIEDLWAFNEEIVVRAVAASAIPVITAVGHETDTTLIDFAGDHRAPTPTAAAERAVPVLAELRLAAGALGLRLDRAAARGQALRRERAEALARRLPAPSALLGPRRQRSDDVAERLPRALRAAAAGWRGRFERSGLALRPRLLDRRLRADSDRLRHGAVPLTAALRSTLARDGARLGAIGGTLKRGLLDRRMEADRDRLGRGVIRAEGAMRVVLGSERSRLGVVAGRLRPVVVTNAAMRARVSLAAAARLLDTLGPNNILDRGYAYVTSRDGHVVADTLAAKARVSLTLTFRDGSVDVTTAGTDAAGTSLPGIRTAGTSAAGRDAVSAKPPGTNDAAKAKTLIDTAKPIQERLF